MKKNTEIITKLMDALKGTEDKSKLKLVKRKLATGYWWNIKDYNQSPPKWLAIGTQDEQVARRVFTEVTSNVTYGQDELGAIVQLNVAKLDRDMRERTWSHAYTGVTNQGQRASTLGSWQSNWNHAAFDSIRDLPIVETTRTALLDIYRNHGIGTQVALKAIYNYACNEGWMIYSNLVTKSDWRKSSKVGQRVGYATITQAEHTAIVELIGEDIENWKTSPRGYKGGGIRSKEQLREGKAFFGILWELGASNADGAELRLHNINWDKNQIVYSRKKWTKHGGGTKQRKPIKFPMTQKLIALIKPLYDDAMARHSKGGNDYLLPIFAEVKSHNRGRMFKRYREACGIPATKIGEDGIERKLSVHSYRYRQAEYLCELGYTERDSMTLLGHSSVMVHRAYAERAGNDIPATDVMEEERGHNKVISMQKVA